MPNTCARARTRSANAFRLPGDTFITVLGSCVLANASRGKCIDPRDLMTRFACTLMGIWLLAVADLRADNWPNWRGPDNNGVARSHGLPIRWSESRNIVWKLP